MLHDSRIDIKIRLAAIWASVMFCYIYADFFGLFSPGQLATMNRGVIPPLGAATDGVMLGVSLMMALPSVMIVLSVALPARVNRVANMAMGVAYSAIIAITMWAAPLFIFYGVIEIGLTLLAAYWAWTWPKDVGAGE